MKNKEKNKIVPALRFPEFEGYWNEIILETLCFKISDGMHSTPKYDDSGEYYFVNGNNLINGIIIINKLTKRVSKDEFLKHKRELGSNTILLSINGTIGNLSEYNNEKVVLGKSACYINVNEDKVDKKFIFYSLKTEGIRGYFNSELTGSTIKNLSLKTIKNASIKIPTTKEQQKIANCLSSLDNLITAETEKLAHLKDHKKGLLQQLFPANGATKPAFRFAEFEGDGDWEETTLEEVFNIYAGGDKPSSISNIKTKEFYIPILSNGINDKALYGWTDKPKIEIPSLTISARGTIGWVSIQDKPFYPIVRLIVLSPSGDLNLRYAYYFMKTIENNYKTPPAGIPQLTKPMIKHVKIHIPVSIKEQQKIANCLSSVDDLIEAQKVKIKTLKKHKKGLMQQLFPNIK